MINEAMMTQVAGKGANPDLAFRILDGFIGARPPSESLRAALLGQGEG